MTESLGAHNGEPLVPGFVLRDRFGADSDLKSFVRLPRRGDSPGHRRACQSVLEPVKIQQRLAGKDVLVLDVPVVQEPVEVFVQVLKVVVEPGPEVLGDDVEVVAHGVCLPLCRSPGIDCHPSHNQESLRWSLDLYRHRSHPASLASVGFDRSDILSIQPIESGRRQLRDVLNTGPVEERV